MADQISRGLEGVVVAESGLSRIDGENGELYTPTFAMSRVGGWVAHVDEYLADTRLIRPRSRYTGPDTRSVVPIERR